MKPYAIGIDVGGTKIAAGVVNRAGKVTARFTTHAHSEKEPSAVIEAIVSACQAVMSGANISLAQIEGVGLGFPGNTNGPAGVVLSSSNLPAWNNFPLREVLSHRLRLPVTLDNDANVAAVGEHRFGAGRASPNMCYVTLSTGFGVGIIVNNKVYGGHAGMAGEVAHVTIEINGPPCSCGKNGCVMAYASGIGISRMVYEAVQAGSETALSRHLPADGSRIPAEIVAQVAHQGDAVARDIITKAGYYSGVGLSIIIQTLNPEVIVIGGGLTQIGPLFMDAVMAAAEKHSQPAMWQTTRLLPWQLGTDIGVIGAAAQVFGDGN